MTKSSLPESLLMLEERKEPIVFKHSFARYGEYDALIANVEEVEII